MHRRFALLASLLYLGILGAAICTPRADAQLESLTGKFSGGIGGGDTTDAAKLTLKATIEPAAANRPAMLIIDAQIAPGWHIYSISQPVGGPIRTKIKLPPSSDFRQLSDFTATPAPSVHEYADVWPGLKIEEQSGHVIWQAPLEFSAGVDPARLEIAGSVYAQICAESCLPPRDYKFVARLAAATTTAAATPPVAPAPLAAGAPIASVAPTPAPLGTDVLRGGHAQVQARIEPAVVQPGGRAQLVMAALPAAPWYIYALADHDPDEPGNPKPTLIELEPNPAITFGRPTAHPEPASKMIDGQRISSHAQEVRWTVPITIAANAVPGDYPISGMIGFMTCKDGSCDPPTAAHFRGTLRVAGAATTGGGDVAAVQFTPAKYDQVKQLGGVRLATAMGPGGSASANPADFGDYEIIELNGQRATTLPMILVFSFLGGLLLNVMPCVLPVIGLKVLSFVEQGGHSGRRILWLNLMYAAGMILVFLILATLAVTLNLSWGQHFNSKPFTITLAALVFAMALSFLGVWEIPIPGFVGSGSAAQAASREGAGGAFAKGVVTTILATPCSGPYLGTVFGFTVGQPPAITYLVFAMIGLGMASPYLLIGAFPRLVQFLPKPGAWMDTFKQLMGFVLLGTVVYLFTTIGNDYFIPSFALLIGVWAACWWIGRMPITLSPSHRLLGWLEGAVVTAVIGAFAFTWLVPHPTVLSWQPFSRTTLAHLTSQGKTVMVDFTADWCVTCKTNLKFAIDTEAVRQRVEANGVVPLLANWNDEDEHVADVENTLSDLKSKSIPLLAIFPANQPNKVFVLKDLISQRQLLDALSEAGPSRSTQGQASAAPQPHSIEPIATRR